MNTSTKALAEVAIADLNVKAKRLGWGRWFRLCPGSNANGVQHSIDVYLPKHIHPAHNIKIGPTYREGLIYLAAMNEMLSQAISEREHAAKVLRSGSHNRSIDIPVDDEESFPIRMLPGKD